MGEDTSGLSAATVSDAIDVFRELETINYERDMPQAAAAYGDAADFLEAEL